jgi:hypothetical protein
MENHPYHEALGGSWWCLSCHAPASIEDPGESSNPVCGECGKRRCEWRHFETGGLKMVVRMPAVEPVPVDAQPVFTLRRLPSAERPTLSQMAYDGYWLCLACHQITKRDEQECCVLCGSSLVEFQEPTL